MNAASKALLLPLALLAGLAPALAEQVAPAQNNLPVTDDELKAAWEACTRNEDRTPPRVRPPRYKAGWESCPAIGDEFAKRTDAVIEQQKKKGVEDVARRLTK